MIVDLFDNTLRELIFAGNNFRVFGCQLRKLVPQNTILSENLSIPKKMKEFQ